jgi:hypothetical protein
MQNCNRRDEESKRKVVNERRDNEEQENVQKEKKQKRLGMRESNRINRRRKMYYTKNHLRKDTNINLTPLRTKKENWQ